jgi:hypothetical protein
LCRTSYVNFDVHDFLDLRCKLVDKVIIMSDTEREHSDASPAKVNGIKGTSPTADGANDTGNDERPSQKPSFLKRLQTKLNLDLPSSLLMLKLVTPASFKR